VSTLAGRAYVVGASDGQGTVATFAYPYGIAVDAAATVVLVVSDWKHVRVNSIPVYSSRSIADYV
jgi:hypothetical protein